MAPEGERRARRVLYQDGPLLAGPLLVRGAQAHHLRSVLRVSAGDGLVLFDGKGLEAAATVLEVGRAGIRVRLQQPRAGPAPTCLLTLAVSMPKPARADWLVEKLSELGVQRLLWLRCEHTDSTGRGRRAGRHGMPELRSRMSRWRRLAEAAAAQCGRPDLLRVEGPVSFDDLLADGGPAIDQVEADARLLADASGGNPLLLPTAEMPLRSALLIVGPEGGLSRQELCKADEAGYNCINLCANTLRVETAAVVGAALLLASADGRGRR